MAVYLDAVDRFLALGDLQRAGALLARLLRASGVSDAERAQLLARRARMRLLAEKPDDALEDLRVCGTLDPAVIDTPPLLELAGDTYFARFELAPVGFADRADAEQAMACYNRLITFAPDYDNLGWVIYQKGRILLSAGTADQAAALFEQALEKSGQVAALPALCYERLGFIELFERRNAALALEYFARAVEVYPAGENAGWLVQLHILRSRAFREQRLYHAALTAARQALSTIDTTAPDYRRALPEAHLAVGEALAAIEAREPEAIDHLVQFLQLSKRPLGVDVTWSRVHETIGELSFRLGRYELAAEAYQAALSFNPFHPLEMHVRYQIARCYYRLQNYQRTIETLEALQAAAAAEGDLVHDYRVYHLLGNACYALERYSQAVAAYHQALLLAPVGAAQLDQIRAYLRYAEDLSTRA
ncbi:MAG: tetratricopeptide repeat protein [Chloroflexi bacterium]|nr:tetratricopeptide repeat protein [Chloroflexota bacterium]